MTIHTDNAVNRAAIVPGELSFSVLRTQNTENVVSQGPGEVDCITTAFTAESMTAFVTIRADIAAQSGGTGGTLSALAALVYRVNGGAWTGLPSYSVMSRLSNSTTYQSFEINSIKLDLPDGSIQLGLLLSCDNGSDLAQQAKFDAMEIEATVVFKK